MAIVKFGTTNYSTLKENRCVYSDVKQKDKTSNFSMILRPRNITLKKLKSYKGLCSLQSRLTTSKKKQMVS